MVASRYRTPHRPVTSSVDRTNQPTEERTRKEDFEELGGIRRKLNTIQALYHAGDINHDAVRAAEKWLYDYIFAHMGYADFLSSPRPADYIKGDIHTFSLSRGKASARISEIRTMLGECAHTRLIMLLVQEFSFSRMGTELYPSVTKSSARAKASAQCAFLLEQLASFYHERRRQERLARLTATSAQTSPDTACP